MKHCFAQLIIASAEQFDLAFRLCDKCIYRHYFWLEYSLDIDCILLILAAEHSSQVFNP